jgi:DNA-binding transcriptional ArsR family regulator
MTDRRITDLKALSAMSHPLRRRMMDVLKLDGPATAGRLADRLDQAVGNVSHHLRVLAEAELIEEVPELARDRRERWWRLVHDSLRWSSSDFAGDAAESVVAGAAFSLNLDRQVGLVRASLERSQGPDIDPWQEAAFSTDKWMRLTPGELAELSEQVVALLDRWTRREVPDDGQRREPVFVFAHGVPGTP